MWSVYTTPIHIRSTECDSSHSFIIIVINCVHKKHIKPYPQRHCLPSKKGATFKKHKKSKKRVHLQKESKIKILETLTVQQTGAIQRGYVHHLYTDTLFYFFNDLVHLVGGITQRPEGLPEDGRGDSIGYIHWDWKREREDRVTNCRETIKKLEAEIDEMSSNPLTCWFSICNGISFLRCDDVDGQRSYHRVEAAVYCLQHRSDRPSDHTAYTSSSV